jgi:hypothetical protein
MSIEPRGGPPRNDEARAGQDPGDIDTTDNHSNTQRVYLRRCVAHPRRAIAQDTLSQMKRRRAASQRLMPLDCGCSDSWTCKCTWPPLSENQIEAGRSAALHILSNTEAAPLVEFEILRALYRRGGADRALAEYLHELAGGEIG